MNNVKKSIGWADFTINPVKGLCPMACDYCYARRMYKRFKWNPEIRYDDWAWHVGPHIPKGSKVFIGSTIELFGDWVEPDWLETIFSYCRSTPSITYQFLTKQPQNLAKWSPFPDNVYIGVSITDLQIARQALQSFAQIEAKVKFASYEPLLEQVPCGMIMDFLDWVIIGQQTPVSKKTEPKVEWIRALVVAADKAKVPVFLKDNLIPTLFSVPENQTEWGRKDAKLRQEFPK